MDNNDDMQRPASGGVPVRVLLGLKAGRGQPTIITHETRWPFIPAIGQRIILGRFSDDEPMHGVVADTIWNNLDSTFHVELEPWTYKDRRTLDHDVAWMKERHGFNDAPAKLY